MLRLIWIFLLLASCSKEEPTEICDLEAAELRDVHLPKTSKVFAPDFIGIASWINSPPLTIDELRGKVVLVDFWSYSCINCVRTFPYLKQWYESYKDKGFVIVGVHSPEFGFEHDKKNVEEAVKKYQITYPVALDNNFRTWNAYHTQFWPTSYLINQYGHIVKKHTGEGKYLEMENAIRKLLQLPPLTGPQEPSPILRPMTNETYLGYNRGASYSPDIVFEKDRVASYDFQTVNPDEVGIRGLWRIGPESITAVGSNSELVLNFIGTEVHLVLTGKSETPLRVLLDGNPVPQEFFTDDMDAEGNILVNGDGKYSIINLRGAFGRHTLTLIVPPGISAYAFSFGNQ